MSNGKNIEWKKRRMGQNVEWKNTEWDKMSNVKTPNGTKHRMKKRRMGQNVEWKYGKKNMCKYFWFFNVEKMVKNVENVREMCIFKIILFF
jgi:hypothetical protein